MKSDTVYEIKDFSAYPLTKLYLKENKGAESLVFKFRATKEKPLKSPDTAATFTIFLHLDLKNYSVRLEGKTFWRAHHNDVQEILYDLCFERAAESAKSLQVAERFLYVCAEQGCTPQFMYVYSYHKEVSYGPSKRKQDILEIDYPPGTSLEENKRILEDGLEDQSPLGFYLILGELNSLFDSALQAMRRQF